MICCETRPIRGSFASVRRNDGPDKNEEEKVTKRRRLRRFSPATICQRTSLPLFIRAQNLANRAEVNAPANRCHHRRDDGCPARTRT